jgi:hypothetical protein
MFLSIVFAVLLGMHCQWLTAQAAKPADLTEAAADASYTSHDWARAESLYSTCAILVSIGNGSARKRALRCGADFV